MRYQQGTVQLWVKPLADGSRAVAILNQGTTAGAISFAGSTIGLRGHRFTVLDVWQHRTFRPSGLRFSVPATSALLLRISRRDGTKRS